MFVLAVFCFIVGSEATSQLAISSPFITPSIPIWKIQPRTAAYSHRRPSFCSPKPLVVKALTDPQEKSRAFIPSLLFSAIEDIKQHRQCAVALKLFMNRSEIRLSTRLWIGDLIRDHPEEDEDRLVEFGEKLLDAFDAILFRFQDPASAIRPTEPASKVELGKMFLFVLYLMSPKFTTRLCQLAESAHSAVDKAWLEFGEFVTRRDLRSVLAPPPGSGGKLQALKAVATVLDCLEIHKHMRKSNSQLGQYALGRLLFRREGESVRDIVQDCTQKLEMDGAVDKVIQAAIPAVKRLLPIVREQVNQVLLSGRSATLASDGHSGPVSSLLGSSIPEVIVLRLILIAALQKSASLCE